MKELILKGRDDYINHMYSHLRKEHPSTKRRMKIKKLKGGRK